MQAFAEQLCWVLTVQRMLWEKDQINSKVNRDDVREGEINVNVLTPSATKSNRWRRSSCGISYDDDECDVSHS